MKYQGQGLKQFTGHQSMNYNSSIAGQAQTITLTGAVGSSSTSNMSLHTPSPTLTIGSGLNINTISLHSLDEIVNQHPEIKKYEIYESPEDILALSVTWKRLRDKKESSGIHSVLHKSLFDKITTEDRTQADAIRDYYSKKIMMIKLKDERRMTPFREDLIKVINSDGKMVKENLLGMIYYLPEFYNYDCDIDYVKSCVTINQNFKKLDEERKPHSLNLVCNLTPVKHVFKNRKRVKSSQYWLRDDTLNAGILVSLSTDNPLEHIWNHLFNTEKVLKIEGRYTRMKMDDFEYFSIDKWKLVQG